MRTCKNKFLCYLMLLIAQGTPFILTAGNQTSDLSPILIDDDLPYRIKLESYDFLPAGLHSYAYAQHDGKWLLLAGRTNGMHTFNHFDTPFNFPPASQNQVVYVIDPVNKTYTSKSLNDPTSGLTQLQIDSLSVTSPQSYQSDTTLYITGGYGADKAPKVPVTPFSTKDTLTAIDIPGLMHWVTTPSIGETAVGHMQQISDPTFQVTGGYMTQIGDNPTLLVFGQNFIGGYDPATSNGVYTQQVRIFHIDDNGSLVATIDPSKPLSPGDPNFRRRDLNVVPVIREVNGKLVEGLVALSGVFLPGITGGMWTVPVEIAADGTATMADPSLPSTFKQGMNNYASATIGLFSEKSGDMYNVLLGGITFGSFDADGQFTTSNALPFTNQVTSVVIDKEGNYTQYFMKGQEYPVILSQASNPGNPLLFGAGAQVMLAEGISSYGNGVVNLDALTAPSTLIGYVVGGIQSTLPDTKVASDSAASPYIFKLLYLPV